MKKGYQLLEVRALSGLFRYPHQFAFAVAILSWLIAELQQRLKQELGGVELEIIKAEYSGGPYPALGVHYRGQKDPIDLGPLIEATIEQILNEKSALDLAHFAGKADVNWEKVLSKVMERDKPQ